MTVGADRTLANAKDSSRKWPVGSLAPRVENDVKNPALEKITGPASGATVKLSKPAVPGTKPTLVLAIVTATGMFAATPNAPREGTEYTFVANDPNNGNVATLKDADATDHSTETWFVWYNPDEADGTLGGQSRVGH
jgi:hypothetical protein